jgi:hypothetical protein
MSSGDKIFRRLLIFKIALAVGLILALTIIGILGGFMSG